MPNNDWGGGGEWGGGGVWTSQVPACIDIISTPYVQIEPSNVAFFEELSNVVVNSNNVNFKQITAQANILGYEIDLQLVNPGNLPGTLIRNMDRFPLDITDGVTLWSGPLIYYADYGLFPERTYYYVWFPNNGDSPLLISCETTSSFGFTKWLWDNCIPSIYKEKDARIPAQATVTTTVVDNENTSLRLLYLEDVTNIQPNTLIQVGEFIVTVRVINHFQNSIVVQPALDQIPAPGTQVLIAGLGYHLYRFLTVFGELLDYQHSRIKSTIANRQIDNCDSTFLPRFAKYVDLGNFINLNGGLQNVTAARAQIKAAISLWKAKGLRLTAINLVRAIVGTLPVLYDEIKDTICFSNNYNSLNDTYRDDNSVDTQNIQTYTRQGMTGDPSRYSWDTGDGAIYQPTMVRFTIQIYSHFERIADYDNMIQTLLPLLLPIGVDYIVVWDALQPTIEFTGTGFGQTVTSSVTVT